MNPFISIVWSLPEGLLDGSLRYLEGVDGLEEGGAAVPGGEGGLGCSAPHHQILARQPAARHEGQIRLTEARLNMYRSAGEISRYGCASAQRNDQHMRSGSSHLIRSKSVRYRCGMICECINLKP